MKVPWTARRSNQSILRVINPEYLLEGLRLKLKLQYFGHLMQIADALEKSLVLEKIEGRRRRERQRKRCDWSSDVCSSDLVRRTDAEVETPVFWSSDANSRLIGKVADAGKD